MLVQSLTFILSPDRDPKEEAAFVPGNCRLFKDGSTSRAETV